MPFHLDHHQQHQTQLRNRISNNQIIHCQDSSSPNTIKINMHFSTISAAAVAALAFLATPAVGAAMPAADLAARSAELDTRAEQLEARAALLVCQFGGDKACSAEVSTDVPDDGKVGKISNHINSASSKNISMAATAAPLSEFPPIDVVALHPLHQICLISSAYYCEHSF